MRTFDLFTSSKMQLRYVLCAATLATCVSTAIHAEIIHGRVDRVIDGDTLQVITADDEIRVRIRGIDAPEADQLRSAVRPPMDRFRRLRPQRLGDPPHR